MGDLYLCPNRECKYSKKLKLGENCPQCGAQAQKLSDGKELLNLMRDKTSSTRFKKMELEGAHTSAIAHGNLGLLEGEEIKLQYICKRTTISSPSMWDGQSRQQFNTGLLVFTNDNMIYMQQEGGQSSTSYAQALRFPLESISGLVTGGNLIKHIRMAVGAGGSSDQHEFVNFQSVLTRKQQIEDIRAEIERHLKTSREEMKRLAVDAMKKGTVPKVIFCKFCGVRNKADNSNCVNCGAILQETPEEKKSVSISQPVSQYANPPPPPPPPPQQSPTCPTCGNPLNYIQQYQRWYCYKDKKYM